MAYLVYTRWPISKYYSAYFHFKKITSDDTSDVYYNISVFSLVGSSGDPVYAYVGIDVVLDAGIVGVILGVVNLMNLLVQYFLWLQNVFQVILGDHRVD